MAITRGELRGRVLRMLNKTSQYSGFYAEDKVSDAIQETLDYLAHQMMMAGEGWQTKIAYYTTAAGQLTLAIPETVAMIKEVRYMYGDCYLVMSYDEDLGNSQASNDTGERQYAARYRIVDNRLYFNPPLNEGGTDYIMLEYVAWPKQIQDDDDFVEGHFGNTLQHYLKYRVATILAASVEKSVVPWAGLESQWYKAMVELINRRNQQSVPIRPFSN